MTKRERLEVTGRAIANRLRHRNLTGARLDRAIEEVADDATTRGLRGSELVWEQTLVEIQDTNLHDWQTVVRAAKRSLRSAP
jgi:hypothetical protein